MYPMCSTPAAGELDRVRVLSKISLPQLRNLPKTHQWVQIMENGGAGRWSKTVERGGRSTLEPSLDECH